MARKGRYPESIAEHVSPERLERFFTRQQNAYQIKRELREICIFSNHSFIKDPPFSRLDLISCRNVMIYLGLDLQRKIIPLFHYALRPSGYLFLGPSETVSSHRELFRTVDKKHRIFQRKQTVARPALAFPLTDISRPKPSGGSPPEAEEQKLKQLERIILQRYRPACVTVQENGDALYFSGRIGRYLEPATGSPDSNVINMAREGLRVPLRTALHKAVTTRERVVQKQIAVQTNGGVSHIDLTVEPIAEFQAANLYMIVFEDVAPSADSATPHHVLDAGSEETIRHLEGELRSAQEHAQAMFEELESSNEELKSANEEYQSTNEELETSKEEVQSFNEELETVNAELTRRVAELDHANSDLQNLNASTQIATIFFDAELRIKSFTPAAGAVFHLIPGDVGRPITDLAAQFANADFADDIKEALRTLTPKERDLPGTREQHYLVRILPYRTVHNVIDGVVITFTDVTQLKQAERCADDAKQAAEDAKIYAESIVDTVREPLLVMDADLRVKSANQSFYEIFGVLATETVNQALYELGNRQWDIPELRRLLREILPEKKKLEDFRVDHDFPVIGRKVMLLNAREIHQQNGGARLILLAIEDITERTRGQDARGRLAAIVDSSADAIVSKDLNGVILSWNIGAERLFGYTAQEAIGRPVAMLIPPDHADEGPGILEHIRRGERVEHYDTIRRRKDGTLVDVSLTVSPIFDENGKIVGASKIARDNTDSKRIEQERRDMAVTTALRNTEAELARVARALTVGEMATSIAHEVNQPLAAVVTNSEACLRWLGGNRPNLHEARESLALIVRDANRASEVIRRIRQFLKKDSQLGPLDINEVVQEALDLGRDQLLKGQVALRTELADGLPAVRGDRIQLEQVMLNLIMNGKDALVSVEDRPRELVVTSQKSGVDGIRVAVRDSGSGATPEDMNRMFNAFFTTKPAGMGMGLSISRSIIEAHGGRIWAELNDGPGLTVQFSVPVESENPS
jgi:two-component system, chemotaxis family, CheB/CheR fusion protein